MQQLVSENRMLALEQKQTKSCPDYENAYSKSYIR